MTSAKRLLAASALAATSAVGGIVASFPIRARRARTLLGDEPTSAVQDGITYRDLNGNGRMDSYENPTLPIAERVADLLTQMTLAEKVGLMMQPAPIIGADGTIKESPFGTRGDLILNDEPTSTTVAERHVNHFFVIGVPRAEKMAAWYNQLQRLAARTRLGIPVTLSTDPRHGRKSKNPATGVYDPQMSSWPDPLGFAAIGDPDVVHEFGRIARQEYRAIGLRMALHPMADLATQPSWSRLSGTFGEDPELAARLVAAYIRGFQGDDGLDAEGVACMVKHFPGGGPQEDGLDPHFTYGRNQIYPGGNLHTHLAVFEAAIDAGVAQVMSTYGIAVGQGDDDVAVSFDHHISTVLLRERLGFDGAYVADWNVLDATKVAGIPIESTRSWGLPDDLDLHGRAQRGIDAGVDQFGGQDCVQVVIDLVNDGRITEERIDAATRRLLRTKFELGLFDDPFVDEAAAGVTVGRADFVAAGELAQRRSIALLENRTDPATDAQVLPIERNDLRIYVEGMAPEAMHGFGTVVDSPDDADLAILRLATPYRPRRGIFDRLFHHGDLDFEEHELSRIRKILATVPTVVDIHLDRAACIPEIAAECAALLATFGVADAAVLDVIFGRFEPTGRLPIDLPSSMAEVHQQRPDVPFDMANPLYRTGAGTGWTT